MSKLTHENLQEYTLRELCHNWPKVSEIGPYRENIRFDVVDVNRRGRKVKIFEAKASRNDFLGDDKWEKYLQYADYFTFVCPEGIIEPEELPEKVGLVYVYQTERREDKLYQPFDVWLDHSYIKKAYKQSNPTESYIRVLEGIASREANK